MNLAQSEALFARAQQYTPGGVNSPVRAFRGVGGDPIFFREASGAWMTDVIDPVVQGDSAATVAALSRYFGGVPRAATPSADARDARAARATPTARVRNATDEFGFVARRGC